MQDPLIDAPEDYIMAARVSVLMRGMALAFGIRMRVAPLWCSTAEKVLLENGVDPAECYQDATLEEEARSEAAARAAQEGGPDVLKVAA